MSILLNIKKVIIKLLLIILGFLKIYSSDFINFLLDKRIIHMAIGILISSQVVTLTTTITDSIINPILQKLSFTKDEFNYIKYNRFGIEFKIGQVITNLITFFMVLTIVFYIWNLSNSTNSNIINDILNTVESNIKKSL
jgi:large-conductance mechanosensitive channel